MGLEPPFKSIIPPKWPVKPIFVTGTYGFLMCLYSGVPVPIKETIWRGKVGTPKKCACIVIVPVKSVPVTRVYSNYLDRSLGSGTCTSSFVDLKLGGGGET